MLVQALIGLLIATLIVFVFPAPWVATLATVGGLGFFLFVVVLIIEKLVKRG